MRIAFTGAQGTGKSTLLNELIKLPPCNQYIRASNPQRTLKEYTNNFKINQDTDFLSQISITSCYSLELISNPNYITDRSLIDTFAYMYASDNISIDHKHYIEDTFKKVISLYDIIFYTPIEFEAEEDGVRVTDLKYRTLIDMYCRRFLDEHYPNYITLSGSVDERLDTIFKTLKDKLD